MDQIYLSYLKGIRDMNHPNLKEEIQIRDHTGAVRPYDPLSGIIWFGVGHVSHKGYGKTGIG